MQPALHQHAGTAEGDRFVDTFLNLLHRMNVRVRLSGPPIECAEGAHDVANVGVIDVAVDDVRNNVAGIFTLTDLVSGEADADKIT